MTGNLQNVVFSFILWEQHLDQQIWHLFCSVLSKKSNQIRYYKFHFARWWEIIFLMVYTASCRLPPFDTSIFCVFKEWYVGIRRLHFCSFICFFQKEGLSDLDSLISLTYNLLGNENTDPVIIFVDAINQVWTVFDLFFIIFSPRFKVSKLSHLLSNLEGMYIWFWLMHRQFPSSGLDMVGN